MSHEMGHPRLATHGPLFDSHARPNNGYQSVVHEWLARGGPSLANQFCQLCQAGTMQFLLAHFEWIQTGARHEPKMGHLRLATHGPHFDSH